MWACAPADGGDPPAGVQIHAAWLHANQQELAQFWPVLCAAERERAGRFAAERDRTRFVAARGLLRELLGSCLGTEPGAIEFDYSPKGKPALVGDFACSRLQFNLAHSGDLAVFAVARHGAVGVDVEEVRAVPCLAELVQRCCSASESAEVSQQTGKAALGAFFRVWTRKEAWLKATGEGICGLPEAFGVSAAAGENHLVGGPQPPQRRSRLRLLDLAPAPGFTGALAFTPPPVPADS